MTELSVVRPEPVRPVNKDGRRWPQPSQVSATVWRLQVSYWRIGAEAVEAPLDQARELRRERDAASLQPAALRALAHQPLVPCGRSSRWTPACSRFARRRRPTSSCPMNNGLAPSLDDLAELAERAFERLPAAFRKAAGDVVIHVTTSRTTRRWTPWGSRTPSS
jgi:hypothetical protein